VLPSDPSLVIEADPDRLLQVIVNLLNNAAKYTNPGGEIFLSCERQGPRVLIRVRDTGIGIPPDMIGHVFDPFVQVRGSETLAQGGLGIGLTLVRRLVEQHGGTVTCHSAGPAQGSEFVVSLAPLDQSRDTIAPVRLPNDGTTVRIIEHRSEPQRPER
jgi:signal transduction histidine kinase